MQYPDFTRWSPQELQKAELAAVDFINDNIGEIVGTFEKRVAIIKRLLALLKSDGIGFEQRMMYLSMVQELAEGLAESAREFFEIGCVPSVANMVQQIPGPSQS